MNGSLGEAGSGVKLNTGYETGTSAYADVVRNMWKTAPIILISFGTFGNLLAISVLLRKPLRAISSNLFLLALTVTDLLILYLGLFRRWLQYTFDIDMRLEMGCGPHIWLLYTCLSCSSWILVALTVERTISVKFPLYSMNGFSRRSSVIVLACIIIIASAMDSVFIFTYTREIEYSDSPPKWNSSFKFVCVRQPHMSVVAHIWYWLDLTLVSFMPFLCLVVCNTYIAHKLIIRRKEKHSCNKPVTKLLVVLSVLFVVTTMPIRLTICLVPQTSSSWRDDGFKIWWTVANIIMYTNNTINFILYCSFGTKFRNELKVMSKETLTFVRKTIFTAKADFTRSFDNAAYENDDTPKQNSHHENTPI